MMNLSSFSKITVFLTFFLVFVGGMVTSTGSGLSVPDWPLSYGMLFPPMVGGVFYEHGHRMVAALVGIFTLIMAIWIWIKEKRFWIKIAGIVALTAVIFQGVLGGITVLFYLPTAVSVSHGTLAQTFFLMTIFIGYSLSYERREEEKVIRPVYHSFIKLIIFLIIIIYAQLLIGAVMRHTESGLAIYDFPTMGGEWIPAFDQRMLDNINNWRFMHDFDPVNMHQVMYHFFHRIGALVVLTGVIIVNILGKKYYPKQSKVRQTIILLNCLIVLQIALGIMTILTLKSALITSFHVVTGAGLLGTTFLLLLRAAPLKWAEFKKAVIQ